MMPYVGVKEIKQIDDRTLKILWTDHHESFFDVVELRKNCPCAVCIDEWTGEKKLNDRDISENTRPIRIDSVGRYALKISFDDQHNTGIYSYSLLRKLDPTLKSAH